jgi:hypothetical protein
MADSQFRYDRTYVTELSAHYYQCVTMVTTVTYLHLSETTVIDD